jgi:hypothetical protein
MNNRGDVAFSGIIETEAGISGDLGMGVFFARPDGNITKIAAPGDLAPDGVFDFASGTSINDVGDVAFDGHLAGEECITSRSQTTLIRCTSSVYLWQSATGHIEAIARQGAPVPGGGAFRFAVAPVLNNRGEILFAGDLTPVPFARLDIGLFLFSQNTVVPVVRPGDPLPGGGNLLTATPAQGFYWLSDNGKVAFNATLDTDDDGDGIFDTGVYVWKRGEMRLIARSGTVVPEVGTIAHIQPPRGVGRRASLGGALVNNRGQVLFQATLTDGRGVLLVAEPNGGR